MKTLEDIKTVQVDFSQGNGEVIINGNHRFEFEFTPEHSQLDQAYIAEREYSAIVNAPEDWDFEYITVFWAELEGMNPDDATTWANWDKPSAIQIDVGNPFFYWIKETGEVIN